ncbi:hypothetical protein PG988_010116 [Apiospora saccharicola]
MPAISALDAPHPKKDVTQRNSGVSPFLRLPLELRIMIYEFAVYVDEPIRTQQAAKGSNKFVWGNEVQRIHRGPIYFAFLASYKNLTATELARTCRMVYHDLEAQPVFYRVNDFHLRGLIDLQRFLAAITPARRSSIRQLVVGFKNSYYGSAIPVDYSSRGIKLHNQVVPFDEPSLLSIPTLHITFQWMANYWSQPDLEQFGIEISRIEAAMVSRRESLDDSQNTVTVTDEKVKKSIAGAGLYFPGEERVNQDQFNSDIGAVSSRTRHRCNKANLNESYGTVERNTGKYDSEGLLIGDFCIHDVRLVDSGIECEISEFIYDHNFDRVEKDDSKSWEPLHTVATNEGIEDLERIYRNKLALSAFDGRVIQNLPAPRDITLVTDAFRDSNGRAGVWNAYRYRWTRLQERYEAQMNKLALENNEEPSVEEEKKTSTKTSKVTARGRGRGNK